MAEQQEEPSERIKERAIKKLGSALRELKTEPVNEVIRGEELLWKVPCAEYHYKCRLGRPKLSWVVETAKQIWDKEKLWRNLPNTYIPTNFNCKIPAQVRIIVGEALKGKF